RLLQQHKDIQPYPFLPGSEWLFSAKREARRVLPGDFSENGAGHEPRASRIVEVKQSADQFPGRVKPGNALERRVLHLGFRIDAQAAEGERDAAGDRIGFEG